MGSTRVGPAGISATKGGLGTALLCQLWKAKFHDRLDNYRLHKIDECNHTLGDAIVF